MHTSHTFHIPLNRRRLIRSLALAGGAFFTTPGLFAELLTLTPRTTAGPFYPDHLPLDQDNDLVHITGDITPAVGTITNLTGRVLDRNSVAIKGALVELWQADNRGNYIHSRGEQRPPRDGHFQGYGRFETASNGGWKFRTIKPALYAGRTRHYHFGITLPGQERRFTTQLFFSDEPANAGDMVLGDIRDATKRASVIREFTANPDTKELAATWDIVMGLTPGDSEPDDHDHPAGPPPGRPGGRGPRPDGEHPPGPPPSGAPPGR